MYYEPGKTEHGLPHDPFKACVVPRPIGWISTIAPDPAETLASHPGYAATNGTRASTVPTKPPPKGTPNLAPYSQFNNLTFDPPYVMFSANQTHEASPKDSAFNAKATGVFCWQLATWPLREAVNATSEQLDYGIDEFEKAGLTKTWSRALKVPVPMVDESPVKMECEYYDTIHLPGNPPMGSADIVIGRVVAVHIKDEVLTNGLLDVSKCLPIARCGYYEYAVVRETFTMLLPGRQIVRDGLEGNAKKNREYHESQKRISQAESSQDVKENGV